MTPVKTGLDVLLERSPKVLKGARLGLISHQASVDSRLRHAVALLHGRTANLTTLFAPEHGLWGVAQDQIPIHGQKEPSTGLPVYSLYGPERIPSAESLQNVDVLLCDLQDVGSRYYTFVWTMALAMQACAKYHRKFVVLDRPNPIGGEDVEGPILDMHFASFVGLYPVPARHGMTIGELALWMNETFEIGADLEVVPMKGWRRKMDFSDTGLPWVLPSPNMPTLDTARVYPGQCLIEGTNLSEGRGTTRPFEIIGAPFVNPDQLSRLLNSENLPGVSFRPCRFEPAFHKFKEESCGGIQLHVRNARTFKPFLTGVSVIKKIYELYHPLFTWRQPPYEYETRKLPIDILCGTDTIRLTIESGEPLAPLEKSWQRDTRRFLRQRKPFLLYN